MATTPLLAQDDTHPRPFPQNYNSYEDYRDFNEVAPQAGAAVDYASNATEDMSVDELEALLPAHLRTPLPMDPQVELPAAISARASGPASPIEQFFRNATGDQSLTQFGYDVFTSMKTPEPDQAPIGAVQDDYVLGIGDNVTVMFLGERKDRHTYKVGRNGALSIDLMPSVAAAGKTLEALRSDLQKLLDVQGYHGEIFVSLENIRQVAVLVAGHVQTPGRQIMTPLQTVLEALEAAGGVSKTGTLRQIKLIRGGEAIAIDLYSVIGAPGKQRPLPALQDGDRIIVPPLGPTIAISGDARQPGIYELNSKSGIAVAEAIQFAGGVLSRGQNRITLMTPQSDGQRISTAVASTSNAIMADGAILEINRSIDRPAKSFTLYGEVRNPGNYPLASYKNLGKILRAPQIFGDDVYSLMGVVSRRRETDLARDLVAFSPQDVFMGRSDLPLQDGDQVYLLSRADVTATMEKKKTTLPPLVQTFVREHGVSIQGSVRLPGNWPVAGPVPVSRLLDVAGGTLTDADLSRAEILRNDVGFIEAATSAVPRRDVVNLTDANISAVTLTFGDGLRIPDRFEAVTRQTVTVSGEVRNPGTYDLMRGDTILTIIDRAGGLTDQAYPLGAVFSRASERRREKEKFSAAARDLERAIAMAAQNEDGKVDMQQM
ncbi:MAG TPA: SLBB domain-containing protein, partial [Alphaproteobacteria bacterium]